MTTKQQEIVLISIGGISSAINSIRVLKSLAGLRIIDVYTVLDVTFYILLTLTIIPLVLAMVLKYRPNIRQKENAF